MLEQVLNYQVEEFEFYFVGDERLLSIFIQENMFQKRLFWEKYVEQRIG